MNEITQAVTPLLRTFFVGILQNPFAFEALQNFTTSPTTQGLLSGLRNATDLGLPELRRVLVSHLLLGLPELQGMLGSSLVTIGRHGDSESKLMGSAFLSRRCSVCTALQQGEGRD